MFLSMPWMNGDSRVCTMQNFENMNKRDSSDNKHFMSPPPNLNHTVLYVAKFGREYLGQTHHKNKNRRWYCTMVKWGTYLNRRRSGGDHQWVPTIPAMPLKNILNLSSSVVANTAVEWFPGVDKAWLAARAREHNTLLFHILPRLVLWMRNRDMWDSMLTRLWPVLTWLGTMVVVEEEQLSITFRDLIVFRHLMMNLSYFFHHFYNRLMFLWASLKLLLSLGGATCSLKWYMLVSYSSSYVSSISSFVAPSIWTFSSIGSGSKSMFSPPSILVALVQGRKMLALLFDGCSNL